MNSKQKGSLTQILVNDILRSANIGRRKIVNTMINLFGKPVAGWLADLLAHIDRQLTQASIMETANQALYAFADGIQLNNQTKIPASGPLLVVSNHPGMGDIMGVLASLDREDVKIVAQRKEFMRVLGNINRYMLSIEDDSTLKFETIRKIIQALRDGMAVIIFPAGSLEPDPAIMSGADEALDTWSKSIGIFLNKVPETRLLPVLVSGVVTQKAWRSRFARIAKMHKRRHQLAMAAEFIMQRISKKEGWKQPMRIDIGLARSADELDPGLDPQGLNLAVRNEMLLLLEELSLSSENQI